MERWADLLCAEPGFREEAGKWGWCRDEFVESNHIPPQLYIREARRMLGLRIFTQQDTRHAARGVLHLDAIAIGDYGHSSHGTRHEGFRFGGKREGEGLGVVYAPYQVPYGTIVAKDVRNVLAPAGERLARWFLRAAARTHLVFVGAGRWARRAPCPPARQ